MARRSLAAHAAATSGVARIERVEARAVHRLRRLPPMASILVVLGLAAAFAAVVVAARSYPAQLLAAADSLAATTAVGGQGYRFDVEQRQVQYPRAGGGLIPVADPANPNAAVRMVDHLYVNSVLARGSAAPGAFWMEMRFGPDETTAPDYDTAPTMFQVIARDGALWRNDGAGWFSTAVSPGVGMDPVTASRLPQLLRSITDVTAEGRELLDGQQVRRYTGVVDVASFPGVVASDGAAFTENPITVRVWLDSSNRLVRLEGQARNLNQETFDLKVLTTIRITYAAAGPPPLPEPALDPASAQGAPAGAR